MRSPAEWRTPLERACRALALATIVLLLWRVGVPHPAAPGVARTTRDLDATLRAVTAARAPELSLAIDSLPGTVTRDWIAAVRGAGTRVRWSASAALPATALAAEPAAGPEGGIRVSALATAGTALVLSDSLGVFDSSSVGVGGVRVVETLAGRALRAAQARAVATARAPDSTHPRGVLVIARAGWEGRFTAAALEEAGWKVETDFQVTAASIPGASPVGVRTRDAGAPIDTARYAVVVALDGSAAARGGAIAAFVRSGGGLVLAADAAQAPLLAGLSPARPGSAFDGSVGGPGGASPRRGLAGRRLEGVRSDAVVIERVNAGVAVAARREHLGRVVLQGYDDTWRWRMQGAGDAPSAHREWWSRLVASAARVGIPDSPAGSAGFSRTNDPAPLASLVAALGVPAVGGLDSLPVTRRWEPWLLALCIFLLMVEWTSRRTRGVV